MTAIDPPHLAAKKQNSVLGNLFRPAHLDHHLLAGCSHLPWRKETEAKVSWWVCITRAALCSFSLSSAVPREAALNCMT